jgi:RHS repeat-associated protein
MSYTYDNNGSTQSKTDSTGTTNYTWDFENRLTSVALPGTGGTVSFKYDPFGRRAQKALTQGTTTTTTNYVFDGDNSIEEVDQNGGVLARYEQGLNIDEPLAMLRGTTASYYHADGLGSVTSLTDSTGATKQTYSFDSFGNQTASTGSLTNPFRYTGREFDTETNLYFYRARYFDPASGRFLSEDPTGFDAGIDFYTYVENSPTNYEDPQGLQRYKCPLFGPCQRLTRHEQKLRCSCGSRSPDFYNLSGSYGAPWGPTGSVSIDRQWNVYVGLGVQAGKSPTLVGGSLTANHLDSCRPTPDQLDSYLRGANISVTGALGLAVQQGVSPTNVTDATGHATGYGVGTPQVGISGTYSVTLSTAIKIINFLSNLVP